MSNATWWVRWSDKSQPDGRTQILSLSSADLTDPRKARKRAMDAAKIRLAKKGVKAQIHSVQCVG